MNRKRKRDPRRTPKPPTLQELSIQLKSLVAMYIVEVSNPEKLDDPYFDQNVSMLSPERSLELCLADPNIYKTPGGNMLTLVGADGVKRFMTPAEAELWQIRADVLDEENPEGTRP